MCMYYIITCTMIIEKLRSLFSGSEIYLEGGKLRDPPPRLIEFSKSAHKKQF